MRQSGAALLLPLLCVFSGYRGEEQIKVLSGSDVEFKAEASGRPTEINWYKENTRIVDVEDGMPPHYYSSPDRVLVGLANRTFILKNVTPKDNAVYRAASLVMGKLENSYFRLQVIDHVCEVVVHNISRENNITLHCMCSNNGTSPSKYGWYNGSVQFLSEEQNITVSRIEGEPQEFKCVASNEVSKNTAIFRVPSKEPEPVERTHIVIIIVCIVVLLCILAGIFLIWQKTRNKIVGMICPILRPPNEVGGPKDKEKEELNPIKPEAESSKPPAHVNLCCITKTASKIIFKKAEKLLMIIELHSQSLDMERLSVQRGSLKIMQVEESDYGTYTAKVHLPGGKCDTFTFHACEFAQNGEGGARDGQSDSGAVPVYPQDEVLNIQICDAKNADKIIWKKDGRDFLTVTCASDPLVETLALSEGALSMDLISGDKGLYIAEVTLHDGNNSHYKFDINVSDNSGKQGEKREPKVEIKRSVISETAQGNDAALRFGDLTLFPVNVRDAEQIIWKKNNETIVEWKAAGNPRYTNPIKASLNPASGDLTLKNLEETNNGTYVIEATGDKTTKQAFVVTIKLETRC